MCFLFSITLHLPGLMFTKGCSKPKVSTPGAVEEAIVQIDWGELEPLQAMDIVPEQESSTGDIDWDVVGALDMSEIEIVEDSVLGEDKGRYVSYCGQCHTTLCLHRVGHTLVTHKYTQPLSR